MSRWAGNIFGLLFMIALFSLFAEDEHFICIEGGGSKTILQLLDREGQIVSLMKDGVKQDQIKASGSNLNAIGIEGVKQVLDSLFEGVFLAEDPTIDLYRLMNDSYVIAGMAGAASWQTQQSFVSFFEEKGGRRERIVVMSDVEMALELLDQEGICLIAGTGSICMGKRGGEVFRVGGLGRILGDEGSGYDMGLQALKAALAEEYGWGASTRLTADLREWFCVSAVGALISKVNRGEIAPSQIAASAPFVFQRAWEKDPVAEEIVEEAARRLSGLLCRVLQMSSLSHCEVHLWGGIFKGDHAESWIEKIVKLVPKTHQILKIINRSQEHLARDFVIQKIFNK